MRVKQLARRFEQLSHRHALFNVWSDFLLMAATSIANAVDLREPARTEREAEYMRTVAKYSKEEATSLAEALAEVVDAMTEEPGDVLGQLYMHLELGNKWTGQFFTPDALCKTMAAVLVDEDMRATIDREGFITVQEPAVGGGAMIIGLSDAMRAAGLNPQRQMHVTAIDVDIKAVHMAYIQFSLLHIPAVIVHGNALSLETHGCWYTPAHILDGWGWRLRRRQTGTAPVAPETVLEAVSPEAAPISDPIHPPLQGDLFQEAA